MRSKNKTVTILGGNGYIGSHVAEIFSKKGYFVKVLDTKKPKNKKKNIRFFLGSILEKQKLKSAIKNANFVFNFAALADIDKASDKPYITAEVNVLGVINILNICKLLGVKKLFKPVQFMRIVNKEVFMVVAKKLLKTSQKDFMRDIN